MQIRNGIVLNGSNNRFERIDLRIENGKIYQFGVFPVDAGDYDAEGYYIIPGFIDTHIHGCVGVEFASEDESFDRARRWLASEGVTSFAATVRALPPERVLAAERNIVRESQKKSNGAKLCGINLEGPFVSLSKSGVMNPPDIECNPSDAVKFAEEAKGLLKIMTLAPERENATETILAALRNGVNISLGHSEATYSEAMAAIDCGASRATHVFNAMRSFSHRETGILGAVLNDERVNCEMICDFVHLDPTTVMLVYKLKGAKNITLVSDTGFMSGLGDGEYVVDGRKRIVQNGVCRNPEGRIAGSCVSMLAGARNLLSLGIPLEEISVMASLNPARALGIDGETGLIREGKYADLIVCDKNLNIKVVFVNGVLQDE
ncbi:MAG: N-acetylglucosamine-6-phosphate deacetylase [Clostridia bacterium]|nr:N-acetylglucosamine-6-phosphate deacetylase [Clostridia bacterium]